MAEPTRMSADYATLKTVRHEKPDDSAMIGDVTAQRFKEEPNCEQSNKEKIVTKKENQEKEERTKRLRAKQAEAARQRYHRLTPDEKKDLNLKRTLAQKRQRQREKELSELEQVLRMTNDIVDDPEVTEQLREKRMRARWAEATRTRYQRMSSEERRIYNTQRRVSKHADDNKNSETSVRDAKQRKAEAARLRYHRMSAEEKKAYNRRRTEASRRRRSEEKALLDMSVDQLTSKELADAQRILVRNAKRADTARLRYYRMTLEQRQAFNQRRRMLQRQRAVAATAQAVDPPTTDPSIKNEEHDPYYSLEREVLRMTTNAKSRQRARQLKSPTGEEYLRTLVGRGLAPSNLRIVENH